MDQYKQPYFACSGTYMDLSEYTAKFDRSYIQQAKKIQKLIIECKYCRSDYYTSENNKCPNCGGA